MGALVLLCREGPVTMHQESPVSKNPFLLDLDKLEVIIVGWIQFYCRHSWNSVTLWSSNIIIIIIIIHLI